MISDRGGLHYLFVFLLLVLRSVGIFGEIIFLKQPSNMTVLNGEIGYFPCEYEGTNFLPSWRINARPYGSTYLPPEYTYNGSGLIAYASAELNGSSISCFFTQRGTSVESRVAYLTVVSQVEGSPVLSFIHTSEGKYWLATTTAHTKNTGSLVQQSTTYYILESLYPLNSSIATSAESHQKINLIIVSTSMVIVIVLTTSLLCSLWLMYRGCSQRNKAANQEPQYSEVGESNSNLNTNVNVAYTSTQKVILHANESYGLTKYGHRSNNIEEPLYEDIS